MKMVLTSGVFSIVVGVVAYYILINIGMDSANVMSSINVRLQLHKKNLKIMNNNDVLNFMQTYQRITQQMFKDTIKNSSIVMKLGAS